MLVMASLQSQVKKQLADVWTRNCPATRGDNGLTIADDRNLRKIIPASGAAKWSPYRRIAVKAANQAGARLAAIRGDSMTYKITAERDTETVKSERTSLIIAVAKARVFASEGWQVTITTDDGKVFAPAAFDTLPAA
jgi:hypothetical protein